MYKQEFPKSWTLVIGHTIDLKFNVHQQQYQSKSLLKKLINNSLLIMKPAT